MLQKHVEIEIDRQSANHIALDIIVFDSLPNLQ